MNSMTMLGVLLLFGAGTIFGTTLASFRWRRRTRAVPRYIHSSKYDYTRAIVPTGDSFEDETVPMRPKNRNKLAVLP